MNSNRRRAAIIWTGIGAGAIVLMILAFLGTFEIVNLTSPFTMVSNSNSQNSTNAPSTSSQTMRPRLVLTVLDGNEDNAKGVASYDENNTNPIVLSEGQHIRFESPDYRRSDGMRVIGMEPSGKIHILLKSYDVNNEYFINVSKGAYEIRVQARWLDSTYFYTYNIQIS